MWEQIRSNRLRSAVLILGMGLLLLLLGYTIGFYYFDSGEGGLVITAILWVFMSLLAVFQGDSILLGISNARKISKQDNPRLYNVVEEMAIASGLARIPDIYIINDPAMNAFAAGRNADKASIAVTSGLLEQLDRDELQGVIGHEMAHIKNRDVLLMSVTAVLLGTIVMLSWYATRIGIFGGRSSNRRDSGGGGGIFQGIIMLIGLLLIILAPIMAQLIYYAISRKREYLADASSALYTRYPEGLASALEKISASTEVLRSANQATAPMYIINPLHKKGRPATDLTSTHPPISERIRILRAMGGNHSLHEYDQAYRNVHGKGSVIPKSAISS
jgi:heat shock protein HtpX